MVSIRHLQKSDVAALAEYANNRKIWDNVRDYFPHPYTRENALEFVELFNQHETDHVFSILDDDLFVGVVGIHALKDIYRNTAEVGYWIGEPFWNKGYASMALHQAIRFAWEKTGFLRLEAGVFEHNVASMKVLEKCGFTKEGILQKRLKKNEVSYDEHLYALIKPS